MAMPRAATGSWPRNRLVNARICGRGRDDLALPDRNRRRTRRIRRAA